MILGQKGDRVMAATWQVAAIDNDSDGLKSVQLERGEADTSNLFYTFLNNFFFETGFLCISLAVLGLDL